MSGIRAGLAAGASALVLLAGAGGAVAGSGGVGGSGGGEGGGGSNRGGGECRQARFGDRTLERGDCGGDVKTLNWILRANAERVRLSPEFGGATHDAIVDLQRRRGLRQDGVVGEATRGAVAATMNHERASWYGPGFYGNTTACGQTLRRDTVGVAHRTLPCGTRVTFAYRGRYARTTVIDRGPFVKRRYERDWDLTGALAERLRFEGVDRVRSAPIR